MGKTAIIQALAWEASGRRTSLAEAAAAHQIASELPRPAARLAIVGRGAGRSPSWVNDFSRFDYLGADPGRLIRFSAPALREVAPPSYLQGDFFQKSIEPELTAFTLLGESLQDVLEKDPDSDRYDSVLLKRFVGLSSSAFKIGITRLILEGLQLQIGSLSIGKEAVENASVLLKQTPPPRRVRISGTLTGLNLNGEILQITTEDGGEAKCVLKNATVLEQKDRLGHQIVASGVASFRPSGRLLKIDVDLVGDARAGDRLFSVIPSGEATQRGRVRRDWLGPLVGSWPGDETEAELLAALRNGPH